MVRSMARERNSLDDLIITEMPDEEATQVANDFAEDTLPIKDTPAQVANDFGREKLPIGDDGGDGPALEDVARAADCHEDGDRLIYEDDADGE